MLHVEDLDALSCLIPPTTDLEFAYAWKREVFFLYIGLTLKESITKSCFKTIWNRSVQLKSENLFTEIVVRGDVFVLDNATAFNLIGDYGARSLLFYSELEAILDQRRRMTTSYMDKKRVYLGVRWTTGLEDTIKSEVSSSKGKKIVSDIEWRKTLTELELIFKTQD